ncbi:unnamed protein product [Sphagnum jensenii]|uniref:Uncharacterized protein n=1 Tax=Sphagnum jensenii TaxID=128206 RepID=A0ABP1BTR0_9BRYO
MGPSSRPPKLLSAVSCFHSTSVPSHRPPVAAARGVGPSRPTHHDLTDTDCSFKVSVIANKRLQLEAQHGLLQGY